MRTLRYTCIQLVLFVSFYFLAVTSAHAALVKFDKATASVSVGSTFTLDTWVDAGSDQITSTDMWILYDPTLLEAQSASPSAFFPAVTNNITSGKVYIAGLVTDPGTYKTGSGAVATITFKGLKNGVATITYDCRADVSNSSKVIKNAVDPTNIIVCSQNGTSVITVGAGSSITPTRVPTTVYGQQVVPTALPRTGIMDQFPKLLIAGGFFLISGIIMRVFLLL